MKLTILQVLAPFGACAALSLASASGATVTFDDLILDPQKGYWNGSEAPAGGYTSGGATFHNSYTPAWDSWAGFAVSSLGDTETPGYLNQYSSWTGGGAGGTGNFGVGQSGAVISFSTLVDLTGGGASIANTTYAALSMQQGDQFAKKFGGATGDDPDWFLLTVEGFAGGLPTGLAEIFLADYRFADNSQDYILQDWVTVDFTSLGTVDEIRFSVSSSDTGPWGPNTPAYFAIDNLAVVPEPSAALLLGAALVLAGRRRRAH